MTPSALCSSGVVRNGKAIKFVWIELESELEGQDKIDVLLLKIHSTFSLPEAEKQERLDEIRSHCEKHTIKLSDSLENIDDLGSRWKIHQMISPVLEGRAMTSTQMERVLDGEQFPEARARGVNFPFIVKTEISRGSVDAHEIHLVSSEEGLR